MIHSVQTQAQRTSHGKLLVRQDEWGSYLHILSKRVLHEVSICICRNVHLLKNPFLKDFYFC
jgi:hypothetical protein